jgi:hypothetical protein
MVELLLPLSLVGNPFIVVHFLCADIDVTLKNAALIEINRTVNLEIGNTLY